MTIERVELRPNTDLREILEQVRRDKTPRLIEQNGEPLVVVVSPEGFEGDYPPRSKRLKQQMLSLAGVWRDVDSERLIAELYQRRHETPPSPPVDA